VDKRQRRFDRLQRIGCIACLMEEIESQADIHHIISKGYRKHSGGDEATIPLCPYHHRGLLPDGMSRMEAEAMYGPSLALSKREFVLHFGTEQTLLALVDAMIEQMTRLH
jgi:hypothetical protein